MNDLLEVRRRRGEAGVFAKRDLRRGAVVVPVRGTIEAAPSRYTLQVGVDRHVMPSLNGRKPPVDEANGWAFLNHSCAPNLRMDVEAMAFRALRDIRTGEELTFDYHTTEWALGAPFACRCGAADCCGAVQGFRYLPPDRQEALLPHAAPHIRSLFEAERG